YQALLEELLSGKRDYFEIEKRYRRKSGKYVWARLNGSIVDGADSKLWVVLAEDISERKCLEDELRLERDRLRLLLDLNNQFLSRLELRDFLEAVLESLRRLAGWDVTIILLPESGTDQLAVYMSGGISPPFPEGSRIPIDDTLAGQVYRTGRPL